MRSPYRLVAPDHALVDRSFSLSLSSLKFEGDLEVPKDSSSSVELVAIFLISTVW